MKIKYALHGYWMGWKTRKLISLTKFKDLKRQVSEIQEFYGPSTNGKFDHHILKARQNYVDALQNTVNNKKWYTTVKNDLSANEKKERVQKMRERNQRMKEIQASSVKDTIIVHTKGVDPDQRLIRPAPSYDNRPIAVTNRDDKPISTVGAVHNVEPVQKSQGEPMLMGFNFQEK